MNTSVLMTAVAERLGPAWKWNPVISVKDARIGFLECGKLCLLVDHRSTSCVMSDAVDMWVPELATRLGVNELYKAGETPPTRRIEISPVGGPEAIVSEIQARLLPAVEEIVERFEQQRQARVERLTRRRHASAVLRSAGPAGTVSQWFIHDQEAPVIAMLGGVLSFTIEDENNIRVTWDGIDLPTAFQIVKLAGGA